MPVSDLPASDLPAVDFAASRRSFLWLAAGGLALAAVAFVQVVTDSNLRNIGGPIDVIVLSGVAVVGAVGAAILICTLQSLLRGPDGARE